MNLLMTFEEMLNYPLLTGYIVLKKKRAPQSPRLSM